MAQVNAFLRFIFFIIFDELEVAFAGANPAHYQSNKQTFVQS